MKGALENSPEEGSDVPLTIGIAIARVICGKQYLTTGIN